MSSYLTVDRTGFETIFEYEPHRTSYGRWDSYQGVIFSLPKGSIEHLIGKKLTWKDEPFYFPDNFYTKNNQQI